MPRKGAHSDRVSGVGEHRLDFLVAGRVVVELKGVSRFHEAFRAQVISYLKATGLKVGLLLNFGMPTMKEGITQLRDAHDEGRHHPRGAVTTLRVSVPLWQRREWCNAATGLTPVCLQGVILV